MSRSDWRKQSKIRLIAGLLIAVAFCIAWIGYGLSQSAKYERQARAQTEEYASYTSHKITQSCLPLPRVEKVECLYNARDAQRDQRDNQRDLIAQRQSALWAYIMAAAAVIGMGLSVIGVWLVWTTFRETQKAASISEKTYMAFIALERPRLVVEMGSVARYEGGRIGFDLNVTNIGKASSVVTKGLWASRKTNNFDEVQAYLGNPHHVLVDAAVSVRVSRIYLDANAINETPYFGGVIIYRSALAEMHRSYFCYQFVKESSDPNCQIHRREIKGDDWPVDD